MRYTEARLTEVARLLLDGIDEDAVDFRAELRRHQSKSRWCCRRRFPICWPTARRASRSAWRPSIPPHNAAELCDAALHLIDNPNARSKTLLKYVQGPDFPTGGIIVDTPETHRRGLQHRPRLVPRARALAAGRGRPRHLRDRHHRNSLAGAEVAADREDRRADQREEAAAGRRRPRRIGRGHPPRDRAASRARSIPSC